MNRPIIVILISYIIGILGGLYLHCIAFIFFILFIVIIMFLIKNLNNKYLRFIRRFCKKNTFFFFLISIIFGYIYIVILDNKYNTTYYNDEEINDFCIVVGEKEEKQYKDLYKVKVVNSKDKKRNGTYLYIRVNKKNNIKYGDLLYISGAYVEPDVDRNEKGFNYKNYLKTLKICGTIDINQYNIIEKEHINKLLLYSNKLKQKLKENVEKVMVNKENSNLLIGMLIGDTENLSKEIEEDFLNSNLYHILSVSGGQVSNILIGITIIFRTLKIHKRVMDVFGIIILFEFMFITGLTPSIIRACIMCIISLISGLIIRRYDIANSFGISLLIILLDNPHSINSLSVLLSYFGFLGIIILGSFFIKKVNKIVKNNIIRYVLNIIISSVAAQIFIFPIILYVFGTISLTFIFSNLLIIPLSTVITVIGFFCIICPLKIFGLVEPLIEITIKIVKFFANISVSKIYFITPNILEIVIYYIIIVYVYYLIKREYLYKIKHFFRKYKGYLISIIALVILGVFIYHVFPKEFKINFIDVGQGDCTLVTTKYNKKILIDGGGSEFNSDFDVGEKTVLPYLLKNKILKLDYIVISHFDSDHVGGLFTIIRELNVNNIIIGKQFENSENYKEFIQIIKDKKIKVHIVEAGQKIKIDKNTYIDIIWPSTTNKLTENSINNNSLVFKLNYTYGSILFTGDIEEVAEKAILSKYKNNLEILKADIIKVAHHGSKTSSCVEFLNAVKPKMALIGVGKNNKFGHPSEITINNLKNMGCSIFRTDKEGEIQLHLKDNGKFLIKLHL